MDRKNAASYECAAGAWRHVDSDEPEPRRRVARRSTASGTMTIQKIARHAAIRASRLGHKSVVPGQQRSGSMPGARAHVQDRGVK